MTGLHHLFRKLRLLIRWLVLRGTILQWWNLNKSRRLEHAYLDRLMNEFMNSASTWPDAYEVPAAIRRSGALKSILFIGDCMWEPGYLFPELRKIADLRSLDLRPDLKRKPDATPARETVARAIEKFIAESGDFVPDVILFYARASLLSEETFHLLRRRWQCPLLGMNLDDRVSFFPYHIYAVGDDDYGRWARQFDLNLTNAQPALDWYRSRNLPCYFFPQGFCREPAFAEPPDSARFDFPISFLGSWKYERGLFIQELMDRDIPISLFGGGWPRAQWVENPSDIFRRTQLNLGIGYASAGGRVTNLKGRDFECPGVGACYLTTYHWELPMLYDVGREILCYRSLEDFLELYAYYSRRPEACLQIARAAHRRCAAEHTWEQRFRTLFAKMGLS
jgi:hypothetical protein